MRILNKEIGDEYPCFIIAEAGMIHEGSLGIALKFIDNASKSGADAVKFQMHLADHESSLYEKFRINFSKQDSSRYNYWSRTSFSFKEWKVISNYCKKKNIIFLCSPFSMKAVDQLIELQIVAWKIASGEIDNSLLLNKIKTISNKPLILSTGLSTLSDVTAVLKLNKIKNNFILLQCNSKYPTPLNEVGHKYINIFKKKYNCPSGISDHSGSLDSLKISLAFGANIIETHVTFSKNFYGPDVSSSIDFEELSSLVKFKDNFYNIRNSNYSKNRISAHGKKLKKIFSQSMVFNKDMKKNSRVLLKDIDCRKPMIGMPCKNFLQVVNRKLIKDVKKNTFIKKNYLND